MCSSLGSLEEIAWSLEVSFKANLFSTCLTSATRCRESLRSVQSSSSWVLMGCSLGISSWMYAGAGECGARPFPCPALENVIHAWNLGVLWESVLELPQPNGEPGTLDHTLGFFITLNPTTTCCIVQASSFLAWIIAAAFYVSLTQVLMKFIPPPLAPSSYSLDNAISIVKTYNKNRFCHSA